MVGARVRRQQVAYAPTGSVEPPRVRLALGGPVDVGVSVPVAARDAPALAVMRELAAQYPRYGYRRIRIFLKRAGPCDEHGSDASALAPGALQVPRRRPRRRVATSRPRPLPATGREPRVGLRLRVRHLRQRAAAEVPDGHRRMDAGMPGHRRGRRHPVRPRHRGPGAARERARRAALSALGQRTGVRRRADPAVAARRRTSRRR